MLQGGMALRPIVLYPDPVLLKPTEAVEQVDDRVRALVDDMVETMYAADGIGLAANQVGESLRVCIVDPTGGSDPDGLHVLINPRVLEEEGSQTGEEGCLSFPEIHFDVTRAQRTRIEALDREGRPFVLEAEDLLARVALHEIEHLEGFTFLRNISSVRRELIKSKIRRRIRSGEWVAAVAG